MITDGVHLDGLVINIHCIAGWWLNNQTWIKIVIKMQENMDGGAVVVVYGRSVVSDDGWGSSKQIL